MPRRPRYAARTPGSYNASDSWCGVGWGCRATGRRSQALRVDADGVELDFDQATVVGARFEGRQGLEVLGLGLVALALRKEDIALAVGHQRFEFLRHIARERL